MFKTLRNLCYCCLEIENCVMSNKILVIIGPTASGKTKLAVKLAHIFNGEIVSADSRQVYRGMDVGTGKDLDNYELSHPAVRERRGDVTNYELNNVEIKKIPHHLIDVADPKEEFSLAKYQKLAYEAIDDILARGKLPIVVGGSGLYLQAIVDGYELSYVRPNKELREKLEKKDVEELFNELEKINTDFARNLNESDSKNKRRLIRYIEVNVQCSKFNDGPVPARARVQCLTKNKNSKYRSLIISIKVPKEILHKRIYERLIERLENEDMIGEVEGLHRQGVSWERLESFGLEYKYVALYLQKKLNYHEMTDKLFIAIRQFAKRQLTWIGRWRRQGTKINWFDKY